MNNKGFSLVELLAVIALLAVLLLIFTPNITKMIDKFKNEDKEEMLKSSAISAAKEYVSDGNVNSKIDLTSCTDKQYVSIEVKDELISLKYLESNDSYKDSNKIKVTYDCNNKKFIEYTFVE